MSGEDRESHYIENAGAETDLPPFDDPKYLALLDESDITEEQAVEFLRALNSILVTCVDLGFGVDAVQLAIPELAQDWESSQGDAEFSGQQESLLAKTDSDISANFNSVAAEAPQKDE